MNRNAKFAMFLCAITIGVFGTIVGSKIQEHDCKYHNYPSDMRFYMYCEECAECGYKEKEVEYSIVSVQYYTGCNICGDMLECYKSFVDGYYQEICKGCDYYLDSFGE